MEAYELADLAINNQIRLDTAWAFFLSINSSLIGGIVFIDRKFKIIEKCAAIAIYFVLSLLNYTVVKNSFNVLNNIYIDFAKFQYSPDQPGYEVTNFYNQLTETNTFVNNPWLIPLIYFSAAVLVILAMIFDDRISNTLSKKS